MNAVLFRALLVVLGLFGSAQAVTGPKSPAGARLPNSPAQGAALWAALPGGTATFRIEVEGGVGSGFFISAGGEALTAYHVVAGEDEVDIVTAWGPARARVVGYSEAHDLALLRLLAPKPESVPHLRLSYERPEPGEPVLVLGHAGRTLRAKAGEVLGVGVAPEAPGYPGGTVAVSTRQAVGPGDSGAAVTDGNGEVIGVVSYIRAPLPGEICAGGCTPVAHAVPLPAGSALLAELRAGVRAEGGLPGLGARVRELGLHNALLRQPGADDLARMGLGAQPGAIFTGVQSGSPAERAGLRPLQLREGSQPGPQFSGDVITALNGEPVQNYPQLLQRLDAVPPGQPVLLTVRRGERELRIRLELGGGQPHGAQ